MNPFVVSGFAGEEYFCDRKEELGKLKESFENKRNVTVFSLRRMGKSSLVKYLFKKISKDAFCIYSDIYSARSFPELTFITANAVTDFFSGTFKNYLTKIGTLIKSVGATLTFNEVSGKPELKFGLGQIRHENRNFIEIIKFLESQNKRVLLVFDEFQQLRNFTEKNAEAILRSVIQDCKNINFMFLGSSRSMMESIFQDHSKPFYQSTQFMHLEEIKEDEYSDFIEEKFKRGKQNINKKQIRLILEWCRTHTYYVQYVCNRLYSKVFKGTDTELYDAFDEILKENEPVYYNYKNLLTDIQWKLTSAIAKEGKVEEPLANSFIKKYDLSSASSLKRALDSLLKKEIIIFYKQGYLVYDVFFSQWLKTITY